MADPPAGSLRRALGLTAVSVLVPGLAHLRSGRRRLGAAFLGMFAALLGTAGIGIANVSGREAVRYLVQPRWLTVVMVAAAVLALWWLCVIVSSYWALRPAGLSRGRQVAGAAFVAVLCLVVAAPPVFAGRYAYVQQDLLNSVFSDPEGSDPYAAGHGGPLQRDPWAGQGRVNVLLLGGDGGYNRYGVRTDSMTLASIDTHTGRTVLLSLPRNLQHAPMPPGPMRERFPDGFDDLLNEVYQYAEDHPDVAPGAPRPGASVLKATISEILGVPVDYYVLVNLSGFKDIVDALGGVTIRITEPLRYGLHNHVLQPGLRKLTGSQALWYGRTRTDSDDYNRMRRQRCLLGAIAKQSDPVTVLRRFQQLSGATKRVMRTDIPRSRLPDFVDLALKAKGAEVTSVQFVPPLIKTYRPDWGLIRSEVERSIAESEAAGEPGTSADTGSPDTATGSPDVGTGSPGGGPKWATPGGKGAPGSGADTGRPGADAKASGKDAVSLDQVCQYS